jgi:DNA-binding transcriptional LysR family regulator
MLVEPVVGRRSTSIDDTCSLRANRSLERVGVEHNVVFRSDDNLTTQRLVASGLGVAIVPLLAIERSVPDDVVAIRALNATIDCHIGIIWQADRAQPRAAEAFVTTATAVSRAVERPAVPSLS